MGIWRSLFGQKRKMEIMCMECLTPSVVHFAYEPHKFKKGVLCCGNKSCKAYNIPVEVNHPIIDHLDEEQKKKDEEDDRRDDDMFRRGYV